MDSTRTRRILVGTGRLSLTVLAIVAAAGSGLGREVQHAQRVAQSCSDDDKAKCQKENQACVDFCYKKYSNPKDAKDLCIDTNDGCRGRSDTCYANAGCPDHGS